MPTAKIHVTEGQYDEPRLTKVCEAVQSALRDVLKVPPDDFYQIIHVLPRNRFLHTPSFLGLHYTDDFIGRTQLTEIEKSIGSKTCQRHQNTEWTITPIHTHERCNLQSAQSMFSQTIILGTQKGVVKGGKFPR